jgi:post-segregation antitoxin (ccd killing protein)
MTREPSDKVKQNLSLAPHVRETLHRLAKVAGLDVSAYVTMLVLEAEKAKEQKR